MSSKRLGKEFAEISGAPVPDLRVELEGDSLYVWKLSLSGPSGTPYQGGTFAIKLEFSSDYPFKPPKVSFLTRIYHPNVSEEGNICMGLLKAEEWKPATKMAVVLHALVDLIRNPNPDDALESSIAQLYKTNRPAYDKKVKEWVKKYCK